MFANINICFRPSILKNVTFYFNVVLLCYLCINYFGTNQENKQKIVVFVKSVYNMWNLISSSSMILYFKFS